MVCFALTMACTGSEGYTPQRLSGVIWGTAYNITYRTVPGISPDEVSEAVTGALASVDSAANMFSPASEVSRFNADGFLRSPSPRFSYLVRESSGLSDASGGAFQPTIASLVELWGFGVKDIFSTPTQQQIDSAMTLVGMDKLIVSGDSVKARIPGVRLDFGAIAKGYGVDCVADVLKTLGIKDYIIEIGGEVCMHGLSPRGDEWVVQIDAPVPDQSGSHTLLATLSLTDAAVATSGNYRNFRVDPNGRLTYHTISPITGQPAQSDILSATVVATNTTTADALATACMVLGLEASSSMITTLMAGNSDIFGAIFVTSDNSGSFRLHKVGLSQFTLHEPK